MGFFDVAALLVGLAAAFGTLNYHSLKLPPSIGLVVIALAVSAMIMGLDLIWPALGIEGAVRSIILHVDFYETVMKGMLSFLLFAGALHVNMTNLSEQKWAVGLMATVGVVVSTLLVGVSYWWLVGIPLAVALVFGALISPTDPVAVLGILKTTKVPKSLETKIAGESLFNDGLSVVLFIALSAIAFNAAARGEMVTVSHMLGLLAEEVLGGVLIGTATGYLAFLAVRSVDDHNLEVLITLALALGTAQIAQAAGASMPIAVVVAGLIMGNRGMAYGMTSQTRDYVQKFWHLIDEILNAVLFLMLGFEVFAISLSEHNLGLALLAIPVVLAARAVSVSLPIGLLGLRRRQMRGAIPIMTWGGLRGGVSVALVLSLPPNPYQPILVTATYTVVIFSIVVQGLTVKHVASWFADGSPAGEPPREIDGDG